MTYPLKFTLVVDDFGIHYVYPEHAKKLIKVLEKHYTVSTYWTGNKYCGLALDWD